MADINNPALHKVYLSLGSNIGNRRGLIRQAVELLESRVGHVSALSSLHETEPWGFESPNKFLNACCCCLTTLPPRQVLLATQRIEHDLGRTGKSVNGIYHDRVIDIDILLADGQHHHEDDWERPYVKNLLAQL